MFGKYAFRDLLKPTGVMRIFLPIQLMEGCKLPQSQQASRMRMGFPSRAMA